MTKAAAKQQTSHTTCFEARIPHIYLEEVARTGSYDMKYHHYHSGYEIYYLMEGQRYYFIDRSVFFVEAGGLVFIDKNRIHKTSQADSSYHRRLLIQVEECCMDRWLTDMAQGRLRVLFQDELSVVSLNREDQRLLDDKLQEMKKEASLHQEGYEEMIEYLLRQILLLAFRAKTARQESASRLLSTAHSPLPGSDHVPREDRIRTVNQVAGYLASNYQETASLDEIAARFYINKYYLSRIFRQVTGVTMHEYLHIQRIQKAQEFLTSSLLPITEIAHATGFETLSYFEKIFRRYCGVTPGEYRKQGRHL